MHSSQLFVPPTLVERRRVTLSPDFLRAWQLVGWAGVALLSAAAIDVAFPDGAAVSSAAASDGFVQAAERSHGFLLGLALGLASAVALGRRTVTRTLATGALALGAALAILGVVAAGGAWTALPMDGAPAGTGAIRAFLLAAAYSAGFLALGAGAWRHALRHGHVRLDA